MRQINVDESLRILREANGRRGSARLFFDGVVALDRYFKIHRALEIPGENEYAVATTLSSVVLETLSLEQAMKAIYMFEYRQRVKTNHDVHRIFLKLKEKNVRHTCRCGK